MSVELLIKIGRYLVSNVSNCQALEVVGRISETQLQVGKI